MWKRLKYQGETIKAWAGESQWRAWRADLARFRAHGYSGLGSEGFWALTIYRMQRATNRRRFRILWLPVRIVLGAAKKILTLVTHINLHPSSVIGPGTLIPHVGPIQVHPLAVVGADCSIHQVCTIGARDGAAPVIGDHVYLGCHVCVLGKVTVGDGAMIGAGAVVLSDVPAHATAVGVPARVIESSKTIRNDDKGSVRH